MSLFKRTARGAAWAFLAAAAVAVVLAIAGLVGIGWCGSGGDGFRLIGGKASVTYQSSSQPGLVRATSGWYLGRGKGSSVHIGPVAWVSEQDSSWWVLDANVIRGGLLPPATGTALIAASVHIRLLPIAAVTGVMGVVLFLISRRWRVAPSDCPKCGYCLVGLAPGAACPECGIAPAPARA